MRSPPISQHRSACISSLLGCALAIIFLTQSVAAYSASLLVVTNRERPNEGEAQLIELLEAQDHRVATIARTQLEGTLTENQIRYLESHAGIIITRSANVESFTDADGWASLKTGVLSANPMVGLELGWGSELGGTSVGPGGRRASPETAVLDPNHPIFRNVSHTDGGATLWEANHSGSINTFSTEARIGKGQMLGAWMNLPAANAPNEAGTIAVWETGEENFAKAPAGWRRVHFPLHTNDDMTALTSDGQTAFLNSVEWMLNSGAAPSSALEPHPIPPLESAARDYTLLIDGVAVPIVDWYGSFCYAHASVTPGTKFTVEVQARNPITEHSISPIRDEIDVSIDGRFATFEIEGPRYLRFQADNLKTIFIFLDPHEVNPPQLKDANVVSILDFGTGVDGTSVQTEAINKAIAAVSTDPQKNVLYFPPGLYRSGTINLQSNVVLYVAAGAKIQASDDPTDFNRDNPGGTYRRLNFITAYQVQDSGIQGRGVIDGNANHLRRVLPDLPEFITKGRPGRVDSNRIVNIQFSHAQNVFIEGVFSRNSSSWNTIPHYCTNMKIRHYKVLSDMVWHNYKNEDGIDPDSCVDLTIEDSFFMARDDAIVMKTTGTFEGQRISPDGTSRDMHDILIRNNMIWTNTAAFKFGDNESEASEVYNVRVEDNVVVKTREGVQLRTRGPAVFRDSIFQRNYYERYRDEARFKSFNYRLDDQKVRNISFIDETHLEFGTMGSIIKGTGIHFKNLVIDGKVRDTPESARFDVQGKDVTMTGR